MHISQAQAEKLVQGCIDNNRTSQEALYRLFYSEMLRICHSYLADEALAKEAFNAGFLKVFQSIKNFNNQQGALGGWIRKIMICTSIDLCRKELKFNTAATVIQDADDQFIPAVILEKLYFEDILKHIRTLPAATQTVFNLSVLDGFTHKEISEQLHISEGTSRWHLAEAKRKLRELFVINETSQPHRERRGKEL